MRTKLNRFHNLCSNHLLDVISSAVENCVANIYWTIVSVTLPYICHFELGNFAWEQDDRASVAIRLKPSSTYMHDCTYDLRCLGMANCLHACSCV